MRNITLREKENLDVVPLPPRVRRVHGPHGRSSWRVFPGTTEEPRKPEPGPWEGFLAFNHKSYFMLCGSSMDPLTLLIAFYWIKIRVSFMTFLFIN